MESKSLLVINPNSTVSMTESLRPLVEDLCSPNVLYLHPF
jgi:Asp/Glu/hydantoin racemase